MQDKITKISDRTLALALAVKLHDPRARTRSDHAHKCASPHRHHPSAPTPACAEALGTACKPPRFGVSSIARDRVMIPCRSGLDKRRAPFAVPTATVCRGSESAAKLTLPQMARIPLRKALKAAEMPALSTQVTTLPCAVPALSTEVTPLPCAVPSTGTTTPPSPRLGLRSPDAHLDPKCPFTRMRPYKHPERPSDASLAKGVPPLPDLLL